MILNYPQWQIKRFVWDYVKDFDARRAALNQDIEPTDINELLVDEEVAKWIEAAHILQVPHTGRHGMPYDGDVARLLLSRIAEGVPLSTVCLMDDMPSVQTVYKWIQEVDSFENDYARAKDDAADANAVKLDEIAHQVRTGKIDSKAARVAADIIKWRMAHQKPKKYADSHRMELTGRDGGPIESKTETVDEKELARRLAFMLRKGVKTDGTT